MTEDCNDWHPVPSAPEYEVNRCGNIRRKGRVLKPLVQRDGRVMIDIWRQGKRKMCYLGRLVAETFAGPMPAGYHLHHKDENKANNHIDNLCYLSAHNHKSGHCNAKKLTPEAVRFIRENYKPKVVTQKELAAILDVHEDTIGAVIRGRRWRDIT